MSMTTLPAPTLHDTGARGVAAHARRSEQSGRSCEHSVQPG